MQRSRITAWSTWTEWQEVYKQLASPDPAARLRGVSRVQTWRTRAKLPVAVDITASFVEVMLNDPEMTPSTQAPRSEHELQLLYAMCVVRLVNGIVDTAQRGASAGSIHQLSQELDWPTWFVQLRHDATHKYLPSLPLLRLAAKEAAWLLFERFWRPQQEVLERRGHGLASHRGRVATKPPPVLDRRVIDKRLRFLVGNAAAATKKRQRLVSQQPGKLLGKSGKQIKALKGGNWGPQRQGGRGDPVESALREQDASLTTTAVEDLASLAVDETRLLKRLFATVLDGEPHEDGREALALNLLCAASSDNFALRLVRQVALGALGWAGAELQGTSDERPNIRNICDGEAAAGNDVPSQDIELGLSAANGGARLSEQESDRMLRWLDALLAEKDQPSGKVEAPEGDHGDARLRFAMLGIAPWLRLHTLERAAAAEGAAAAAQLLSRASRVWQVLGASSIDEEGGARLLRACGAEEASTPYGPADAAARGGAPAHGEDGSALGGAPADAEQPAPQARAAALWESRAPAHVVAAEECNGAAQLSLEDLEAYLQGRKRRRGAGGVSAAAREPWTAVGTVFETRSLQVRGAPQTVSKPLLPEGAAEMWLTWAAGEDAARPAGGRNSGPASLAPAAGAAGGADREADCPADPAGGDSEEFGVLSAEAVGSGAKVAPAAAAPTLAAAAETELRAQAEALLDALEPLDLLSL